MKGQDLRWELQSFFDSGKTLDLQFRRTQLKKLGQVLQKNERRILHALHADLKKPSVEAYSTELGICYQEIQHCLRHLSLWARPRKASVPLTYQWARAHIHPQPFGKVLIFSPWNYPVNLLISPLIGALAAGNVILAKPSELSPETSHVLKEILNENFPQGLITVQEGGPEVAEQLLEQQWDYIFFTGSTSVGKKVMEKAARHLTPVTLELGGKSPAWIDASAELETAARRVLWGKFMNAGQTCVAPDYLLLHASHLENWRRLSGKILEEFYGQNPRLSPDYARIINSHHFNRLSSYLSHGKIQIGGKTERENLYISPTLIEDCSKDSPLMREEIFGPILPVISYQSELEAFEWLQRNPKPLAFYLFSEDKALQKKMREQIPFGGGVINDTLLHLGIPDLPFGGIGPSGMGRYHGAYSFQTFSHYKSVVKKSSWPDPQLRYPPFQGKLSLIKKLLR